MTSRETFASRLGVLATMVGVAVGLGNVWRFPYMAGRYGGAAFVVLYVVLAALIGVPSLMAEWSLGRHTRRGTVEAFARAGAPAGRWIGRVLAAVVLAAVAYYNVAIAWVLHHALAQALAPLGIPIDAARILPPERGFDATSFALQAGMTAVVLLVEAAVVLRGLRAGIERASRVLTPVLFASLVLLAARALTLPGAGAGVAWFLAFHPEHVTASVVMAALGQVVFSLALGGTFMVTYGSYLDDRTRLAPDAAFTVAGDTLAGLLAGLAIFPAVFAVGLEPGAGPGLLFATMPELFARLPLGWAFGTLFFGALGGVALLSGIAAFEVLVSGLVDAAAWSRRRAVLVVGAAAMLLALPPMINLRVFVPWDLTFGSGAQTLGALAAVLVVAWVVRRSELLRQLGGERPTALDRLLVLWLRWVVPAAVLAAGAWWLLTDVLGAARPV